MEISTPTKELLFSTVRIVNSGPGGMSVGTGFLMHKSIGNSQSIPFVVTNKHVLANADRLTVEFVARDGARNQPAYGQRRDHVIESPAGQWTGHPDAEVDVAVLPIGPVIAAIGGEIYWRSLPTTQMPTEGDGVYIDAVEEITFIGYPNGHLDPAHLTPIVRRGITATPLELPFDGKPCFLVDGSVFGGSSGSPVFLLENGFYRTGPTSVAAGNRLVLIGIVAATITRERLLPLVIGQGDHVRLAQELNLGIVYNWHAIEETIEQLIPNSLITPNH